MLAIKGGRILTITLGEIEDGVIIVDGGKITGVGKNIDIPEAEVIDAHDKIVMPGLIDAHCHLGIWEEGIPTEGNDTNEMTDPITPQMRAIDGINPGDQGFFDAREGGVTTVFVPPGSGNVIGGLGYALKTAGRVIDEMVYPGCAMKIAFGENPKRVYTEQKKAPMTRMAISALIREALTKTKAYREKRAANPKDLEPDPKSEALIPVIGRKMKVRAHAHRADDILTALRIAQEFDLDLVIEHATEGHQIADILAKNHIPAVVGPSLISRSKVEVREKSFKTPGLLAKAGVKVALMTDHPCIPIQYLSLCGALAVKNGMAKEDALKALTINSAEILGIADQVGSIEVGKDADLIILSGDPFDVRSHVEKTLINGEIVYGG